MKFGVFFLLSQAPTSGSVADLYREALEQSVLAEELGFDAIWIAEHHFSCYGTIPSPLLFAGAVAQRTSRVRLGTAVTILPFGHPLRIAEEAAMVDVLSGGRLDFGVGRGYQPAEFAALGVPMAEARARFDEALAIIRAAWTQERVSFQGQFWQLSAVEVLPKPVQRPHPPIWIAAVSPETFARLGRMGYPFLSSPNFTPITYVKEQYASYRQAYLAAGHPPAQLELPLLQQVYVAPTAERAREEPERYAMWYFRTLAAVAAGPPGQGPADYRFYSTIAERLRTVSYDEIYEHGATFGTPERCVERIKMYQQEIGLNYLLCWMSFGGLPHEQVCASMRLFAETVMPAFR